MRILLHICCGPCAIYPLRTLRASGHDVTGFFYNHNIHPYQEYARRRDTAVQMARQEGLQMIMRDHYDLEVFLANVAEEREKQGARGKGQVAGNVEVEPGKRCGYCYSSRLKATAEAAKAGEFEAFTASLLYSRYQRHDEIKSLGEQIGREFDVKFYYNDFRPGWQEGIKLSKEAGLYRQQYCGCIYSEKERYCKQSDLNLIRL